MGVRVVISLKNVEWELLVSSFFKMDLCDTLLLKVHVYTIISKKNSFRRSISIFVFEIQYLHKNDNLEIVSGICK